MAIVRVKCKNLKNNPHCPHGPTLKFVRVQAGERQEFYACSTCRDRKDCSFYLAEGDKLSERMLELWALETQRLLPSVDHKAAQQRLKEVRREPAVDRLYCHTCGELDISVNRSEHPGHQVQSVISDVMLSHPSQILKPKEGSKREAQYFFTESSTQVIVDNLKRAKVERVICLGTPRVHEMIQASNTSQMDSVLLDLDHRYHAFWPQDKFLWYNMFNRHAIAGKDVGKRFLARFLAATGEKKVALVLDPPFGGHVEPLAATIEYFTCLLAKTQPESELAVIWVFPYFRERQIKEKCPSLRMVDYKIQYGNHKDFQNGGKGRKLGSPVRLYTTLELKNFVLPKSEGYRLCRPCARWVYAENRHCTKCRACASKDGRTYVHCDSCGECVKPQWRHCATCTKCLPVTHACNTMGLKRSNKENLLEPRAKKMKTTNSEAKTSNSKKVTKKNNLRSKGKKIVKGPKSRVKRLTSKSLAENLNKKP